MKLRWFPLLSVVAFGISLASAFATTYSMQTLGAFTPTAINDAGDIVGYSSGHAVLWHDGVLHDINTIDGAGSKAYAINSNGDVVGSLTPYTGSLQHGFLWHDGVMEDLGTLQNLETVANSINDSSKIVGYSVVSGGMRVHAVLWQDQSIQDLGALLGTSAFADSINNTGDIAGNYYPNGGHNSRVYVLSGDTATDLGTLTGITGDYYVKDINNNDWIVGYEKSQDSTYHPFLWHDGSMRDLGSFGSAAEEALAINDAGLIVGYGTATNGLEHAFVWDNGVFSDLGALQNESYACGINKNGLIVGVSDGQAVLWTPVPEPTSIPLLVGGIAGLTGFAVRRRKKR